MEDGQVLKEGKKWGNFEGNASGDLKAAQERLLVLQPNSLAATASPPLWTQGKPGSAESWLLDLQFPNDSAKQCMSETCLPSEKWCLAHKYFQWVCFNSFHYTIILGNFKHLQRMRNVYTTTNTFKNTRRSQRICPTTFMQSHRLRNHFQNGSKSSHQF